MPGDCEHSREGLWGNPGRNLPQALRKTRLAWQGRDRENGIGGSKYPDVSKETWMDLSDNARSQEEILKWAFKPDELVCSGNVLDGRWDIVVLPLNRTIVSAPSRHSSCPPRSPPIEG